MKKLFTCAVLLLSLTFHAFAQQEESIPLIEVEGYSDREVSPDHGIFTIMLEEKSMRVNDAVEVLNQKTKNLSNALKKNKVRDYKLVADNYSVDINRIYRSGQSRDSGYVARQTLRVITSNQNEDLQRIVEAIQSSGDMSFNLHFEISEELKKSLENALLTEALENAEEKAELIANTLGIRSIRVHRVSLQYSEMPSPKFRLAGAAMDSANPEMTIAPEDQKIRKKVLVKYTY
ncbi:SIMPL domain-containing protein [Algoriphagus namhaensis]